MNPMQAWLARFPALSRLGALPRSLLLVLACALIAVVAVLSLWWGRSPDYRVLFSGMGDRDGGAIVTALTQMNVPYRFSADGSAILVPQDRVYALRMQLASQGLPHSGASGFELLDQTRFGASQFAEQVTFQRALEGELANSIQALHAVRQARVHLALPRESLFVRDRQPPTASVLVSLHPGRSLDAAQVSAITWLVSSSVPNLTAEHVSLVDQNGRLLTASGGQAGADNLQRTFIDDVEQRTEQRILTLLSPLLGAGNVRAQASADVDFAQREQTSEVYRPNQHPGQAAVRSEQSSSTRQSGSDLPQGVPGALTNQPPAEVQAPVVNPQGGPQQGAPQTTATAAGDAGPDAPRNSGTMRRDATINYEVDRTISHVKDPVGQLRRLSVAVVINYRPAEDGELQPLPPEEMSQLERLVKDAMGYSAERGDTLSLVNSRFSTESSLEPPLWRDPAYHALALELGRYLLMALIAWLAWRKLLRPALRQLQLPASVAAPVHPASTPATSQRAVDLSRHEDNLSVARDLASKDPRAVAMVLRSWMEKNGKS